MATFALLLFVSLLQLPFASTVSAHARAYPSTPPAVLGGKIKRVVVVMEENRSFDHMLGFSGLKGINGLTGKEWNPTSTAHTAEARRVFVTKNALRLASCDPDHGTPGTTDKIFGYDAVNKSNFSNASMVGFVERAIHNGHNDTSPPYCGVMAMQESNVNVPVLTGLAAEFAVADRFFASHPGPTWPNRLFFLTATSAGLTETGPWYRNKVGKLFPQRAFFDELEESGLTWRNYANDTAWELILEKIAHNPQNIASMEQFCEDARTGRLPHFSWINPRSGINVTLGLGSNDQHPDHDIALGERYYKDIYEAVRASPQWEETLLIITYDEHGGFYDHVHTEAHNEGGAPPPNDGEASYPDIDFKFDRLGVRLPLVLISPWIRKGTVLSSPPAAQKPTPSSQYELTSIMSTVRKLFGMSTGPLTKRDAWSATFEHLIDLTVPRKDCPLHAPNAPQPTPYFTAQHEASSPINSLQKHILTVTAHLSGVPYPSHITTQANVSEWAQHHYSIHAERTHAWRKTKAVAHYQVHVAPAGRTDWVAQTWTVNSATNASFNTLSSRGLAGYCLDAVNDRATVGDEVSVSLCYPSAVPSENRDRAQQWIWGKDSTIRAASRSELCVTAHALGEHPSSRVTLERCTNSMQQRFAWHGPAAGNGYSGNIFLGDDTNSLGITKRRTNLRTVQGK